MLEITSSSKDSPDIILDFFAGSGTTGHAVMAQNAADGGKRRYICVQLPEPLETPVTLDNGLTCRTISDLTKERLRRAGAKIKAENPMFAGDTGFRAYKLAGSNFLEWNPAHTTDSTDLFKRIQAHLPDYTLQDRSEQDILWEMLLKDGWTLDAPLESFTSDGVPFYGLNGRSRVASTAKSISLKALETLLLSDDCPTQITVLDRALSDDIKANAATLFRETKDRDGKAKCQLKVI